MRSGQEATAFWLKRRSRAVRAGDAVGGWGRKQSLIVHLLGFHSEWESLQSVSRRVNDLLCYQHSGKRLSSGHAEPECYNLK